MKYGRLIRSVFFVLVTACSTHVAAQEKTDEGQVSPPPCAQDHENRVVKEPRNPKWEVGLSLRSGFFGSARGNYDVGFPEGFGVPSVPIGDVDTRSSTSTLWLDYFFNRYVSVGIEIGKTGFESEHALVVASTSDYFYNPNSGRPVLSYRHYEGGMRMAGHFSLPWKITASPSLSLGVWIREREDGQGLWARPGFSLSRRLFEHVKVRLDARYLLCNGMMRFSDHRSLELGAGLGIPF